MARWQENYQLYKRYVKNIALIYQRRKDIRAYIELMLSLSVIVIFGIFAIRPTLVTIIELNKEIESKELLIDRLDRKIENLNTAQITFDQNKTAISLVDSAVPDGPLPEVFARQIEGLAKRHNSQLFNLTASRVNILGTSKEASRKKSEKEEKVTDRYPTTASSLEVSFNIIGNYSDITSFIKELERLRRPIFTDTLSLRTGQGELGQDLVLTVVGRIPFVPLE